MNPLFCETSVPKARAASFLTGTPGAAVIALGLLIAACSQPAAGAGTGDGGNGVTDGGAPTDAGTSPNDAGTLPGDAGTLPGDAGTNPGGDAGPCAGGIGCCYSYSGFNSSPSVNATSEVTWTCTATERTVTGNGLPDHDVGTFPNSNCPNTIAAQTVSSSMPLTPSNTGTSSPVQPSGFAMNGVKFDPGTAGTCTETGSTVTCSLIGNTGSWNIEALGQTSFNFGVDDNNAHVQPTGAYHYHGMPNGILTKLNKGMTPTLVGFALDGFPIYARYGYTSPMDATSTVKVMTGSWQLKTTPDSGRPSTTTYPMGAFSEDYHYVAGSGDLDECNGRTDVTPEYPNGTYHYYITDTYPFIQRCVMGTAQAGGMMMMGMGGDGGTDCATAGCTSGDVCCPSGQPCAGMCVPDCRTTGSCPTNLTCDQSTGVCLP